MDRKDLNLMASCAIFRNLYDNKKDIYDVIAEYIIIIIYVENKYNFSIGDINQTLERKYGFSLPDAVIKTTIANRLKKKNIISYENGFYKLNKIDEKRSKSLKELFSNTHNGNNDLFKLLIKYVEDKTKRKLNESESEKVIRDFNDFIIGINLNNTQTQLFTSFIIKYKKNEFVERNLNLIKQGYLLYQGIIYTSDLNELGSWNDELTIFLDTEHLLNSCGYNGILFSEIFNDFFKLVNDINSSNNQKKIINLHYFEETKNEIESIFKVAEDIISGRKTNNSTKIAMAKILENCNTPSDVIQKKSIFFQNLRNKSISPFHEIDYFKTHTLNIESEETLKKIESEIKKKSEYDEEESRLYLKIFNKINVLRNGINNIGFDRMKYVFLTANQYALNMSFSETLRPEKNFTSYATRIDYITNRFWFKLKKGFTDKNGTPKIFSIISNSQIQLASQLNFSIEKEFIQLTDKYKKGELTKESAVSLNIELREHSKSPEDIGEFEAEEIYDFLNNRDKTQYYHDKQYWKNQAEDGFIAIEKLKKKRKKEIKKVFRDQRNYFTIRSITSKSFLLLILAIFLYLIYYFTTILRTSTDSLLAVFSLISTLLLGLIPMIKIKNIFINFKNKNLKYFKAKCKYWIKQID
jgi:hypothetical protein